MGQFFLLADDEHDDEHILDSSKTLRSLLDPNHETNAFIKRAKKCVETLWKPCVVIFKVFFIV